ncbi:hypothetical protein DPMN_064661 [Dreissena polymorpha]|uniref:Uncharacterized protein n=1 Tax=Dreissena polymorpha TaxID=45954 RepID=A0A9D4HLB8_DREPO|nr:hypothetical protein DPMN_064661 [Dreissena polymorpha]
MSGSGLQEVLQTVYAGNAVTHMMTGKAVSRATRRHFLVDNALHALLISKSFGVDLPLERKSSDEITIFPNQLKINETKRCVEEQPMHSDTDLSFPSNQACLTKPKY